MTDTKTHLHRYLQEGRDAVLWKLQGLGEYDLRRPLTPTGTNLLGLVKHLASNEAGYFGEVFARPFPEPMPWVDDAFDSNADMWTTPDQSRDYITGLYQRVGDHADTTIRELDLESTGTVPWWPNERATVTLAQILTHMIAETHRHAGHADITREFIDGAVGLIQGNDNMAHSDQTSRAAFRDTVEQAARQAAGR